MIELTAERLRELINYDPETGIFTWRVSRKRARAGNLVGNFNADGYLQAKVLYKLYRLHRLAWLYVYGTWPKEEIDHINRIRTDNRISNLREANRIENGQNRSISKANTSGYKGVYWNKTEKKWHAQIRVNGLRIHLGHYKNIEDAHNAYVEAAKKYHTHNPAAL